MPAHRTLAPPAEQPPRPRDARATRPKKGRERALAYLRVSTPIQQEHGSNLDSQLDDVRAYCHRKGYRLTDNDVYRDTISGARMDRTDYYRLLDRIERADAQVIVSYEVSRLGRNGLDNAWLLVKAKENGFRLETVTGGRDFLADPESEFMFDILSAVAKYERNAIMWRMMRGKKRGNKEGRWVCGEPPFGYATEGPRGGRVLVPSADAPLVVEMFERYARGESLESIAGWLRGLGLRRANARASPRAWAANVVGRLLQWPVYLGMVAHGEDSARGLHAPLVSQELWDRVQARREIARARYPGRPPRGRA